MKEIKLLFEDDQVLGKIRHKLPILFHFAELECWSGGVIKYEVNYLRRNILISLLMSVFGDHNVETSIPISKPDADVLLYDTPLLIRTMSCNKIENLKIKFGDDERIVTELSKKYKPMYDLFLVHINWSRIGAMYYIPEAIQTELFNDLGAKNYLKIPRLGSEQRAVEIRHEALKRMIDHPSTLRLVIDWKRVLIYYRPYEMWFDLWNNI